MLLILLIHTLAVKMFLYTHTTRWKYVIRTVHAINYKIVITILQLHNVISNINNGYIITVLNCAFSRACKVYFNFMW